MAAIIPAFYIQGVEDQNETMHMKAHGKLQTVILGIWRGFKDNQL